MSIINYPQPGDSPGTPLPPPNWAAIDAWMAEQVTASSATERVRLVNCGHCWVAPGRPCTITGPPGDHLSRWQRAERRGLIGREDLGAVVARLEVIAPHVIIRDDAQ